MVKDQAIREKGSPSRRWSQQHDAIINVAASLFSQKGYVATSIQDISAAAKLNKASIYYYFKDKSELLYQIIARAVIDLTEQTMPLMNEETTSELKLERMVKHHLDWVMRNLAVAKIDQSERRHLARKQLTEINRMRDDYQALFKDVVEQLVAEGSCNVPDAVLTTAFILGFLNSITAWYKRSGPLTEEEVRCQACAFVFRALGVAG